MHRKRVTSELHDSYFHLMTIKHSISKIEWASNDYITQFRCQWSWRPDGVGERCGKESHTRPKGPPEALMNWGPEKMLIRCSKGSHHPAEWTPGLRLSIRRTRKTQRDGHKFGVKILKFLFGLQHPLIRKPWTTLSNLTNKVRGTNILLKKSSCIFVIACVCYSLRRYVSSIYICIFRYDTAHENITPSLVQNWLPTFFKNTT